ncbi:carbamoyltransferase HypF [Nocardia arthritidis]|uniref:Carbamoyltransferase n=1 Tax=Nocardia arthritidis TaxID=228602 RepID=A0A6G9YDU2_9NOCA|nr:carbamoyltransferase HypF [Nocardia arthritidis]QIS11348.1 carbamoyltransferase HypF [Nocardia arthritidis]
MTRAPARMRRVQVTVHGVVQGVGYRPFVYRLAHELGLTGDVRNAGGQVVARVAGDTDSIAEFVVRLQNSAPAAAVIDDIAVTPLAAGIELSPDFAVADSGPGTTPRLAARVPPDLAICPACLRELFDPADRRYRYPFLNCTDCGPRATVIDALPYDRERTAMREFPLCPACAAEYRDPADRRFHAEPTSCPDCGPRLNWLPTGATGDDALSAACAAVAAGGIVAIKGIGGYQLVCDAQAAHTVARLRACKPRPTKPLAVMVRDLAAARTLGAVDTVAAGLLTSPAAPIVLLPRRVDAPVAADIAPGTATIGVFLPYSPLHHLLLAELDRPLVVTSGNRGGVPTVIDDAAAVAALGPIVDGVLCHDRAIRARYDDSVVRVVAGRTVTLRRARGYAPGALPLPIFASKPVLAVGAQLKHTAALAISDTTSIGPHLGDLADADAYAAFEAGTDALCRLSGAHPEFVAHDRHPGYLSTAYARAHWPVDRRIVIQHHHAHVAATAAEHLVSDPFVGIALDGLGFGDDGTLWGGEVLLANYTGYRRVGRFATAPLPGGAAAVRRPARMALGYLWGAESFGTVLPEDAAAGLLDRLPERETAAVRAMIERNINCPRASSAGRLFDALAALLGLCDDNSYEGEAAVRLEAAAAEFAGTASEPLRWALHRHDGLLVYDPAPTLCEALACDRPAGEIAARFHRTIAEVVVAMAVDAAAVLAPDAVVCLGGGVFQNALLTSLVLSGLAYAGLKGLVGERVPMNDGGICYGQAAIAAATIANPYPTND